MFKLFLPSYHTVIATLLQKICPHFAHQANTLWDIVSNLLFFPESTILCLPVRLCFSFIPLVLLFLQRGGGGGGGAESGKRRLFFSDCFFFNLDGSRDH